METNEANQNEMRIEDEEGRIISRGRRDFAWVFIHSRPQPENIDHRQYHASIESIDSSEK